MRRSDNLHKMFLGGAVLTLIILLLIGALASYLYKQKTETAKHQLEQIGKSMPVPAESIIKLSPEVIASLTPPPGSKPVELSPEVIASLTPPPGSKPVELSPEVIASLTPTRR